MRFISVLLLSSATGFLALAQEIIWVRILMYYTGGRPQVFAYVLGSYLAGIAIGSWWSRKLCNQKVGTILISRMLFFSSIVFYFTIGLISYYPSIFTAPSIYILVGIVTVFTGTIFPLLAHFGINTQQVGQHLSWIYLFNIIGATFGSGITGFYLMENHSITNIVFFVLTAGLILSLFISLLSQRPKQVLVYFVLIGVSFIFIQQNHDAIFVSFLEKLHYKRDFVQKGNYKYSNENRSGIIATHFNKETGCDVIYGGGVYDSCFNVDPDGPNWIERVYAIVKLHPAPKNILVIGLSSGSWVRALTYSNIFEKIDVVEINHGYLDLIKQYPEHSKIFEDPRVTIHIDDGRRWLNHTDEKYDFILMNTTFHWRSYITNLVSSDFLNIIKNHLNPGGVVYYNTTGSEDIIYTAANIFSHVVRYGNFVAASDRTFSVGPAISRSFASTFMNGDKPVLIGSKAIKNILSNPLPDVREQILSRNDLFEITDDNMAVEYKKKLKYFFNPDMSWGEMYKRLF